MAKNSTTEALSRLYSALVEALAQSRHHRPDQPVTVAEIYQDLIPYRVVRTTVGFALNEDYEHALLKLLAGEGGYARVEPDEVQHELRLELRSSNPNVGMYRNYAACDVFVKLPADFEGQRAGGPDNRWSRPVVHSGGSEPVNGQPAIPGGRQDLNAEITALPAQAAAAPGAANAGAEPFAGAPMAAHVTVGVSMCKACSRNLPAGRATRFCPFCGSDQGPRCSHCDEGLETSWKFCVSCGTPAV